MNWHGKAKEFRGFSRFSGDRMMPVERLNNRTGDAVATSPVLGTPK